MDSGFRNWNGAEDHVIWSIQWWGIQGFVAKDIAAVTENINKSWNILNNFIVTNTMQLPCSQLSLTTAFFAIIYINNYWCSNSVGE